jgi:hypothetical protein
MFNFNYDILKFELGIYVACFNAWVWVAFRPP